MTAEASGESMQTDHSQVAAPPLGEALGVGVIVGLAVGERVAVAVGVAVEVRGAGVAAPTCAVAEDFSTWIVSSPHAASSSSRMPAAAGDRIAPMPREDTSFLGF
jgi:hypothetical protein